MDQFILDTSFALSVSGNLPGICPSTSLNSFDCWISPQESVVLLDVFCTPPSAFLFCISERSIEKSVDSVVLFQSQEFCKS
jgi:hypothetical protein